MNRPASKVGPQVGVIVLDDEDLVEERHQRRPIETEILKRRVSLRLPRDWPEDAGGDENGRHQENDECRVAMPEAAMPFERLPQENQDDREGPSQNPLGVGAAHIGQNRAAGEIGQQPWALAKERAQPV